VLTISRTIEFDAGHRVPNHDGQCCNPHGHRYRVVLTVAGHLDTENGSPSEGMVLDFGFLKTLLMRHVHSVLDHGFIVHVGDTTLGAALGEYNVGDETSSSGWVRHDLGEENRFGWKVIVFPTIPTAENIASWIWQELEDRVRIVAQGRAHLCTVLVQETPNSIAEITTRPAMTQ